MSRNQIENQFSLYMLGLNLLSLPEYRIDSMPLKGGVKGEEEGKREGNGEQSLRVLTQSDSYK